MLGRPILLLSSIFVSVTLRHDLRHVKEPQIEIRASEQNFSDFSRSMSEATLMT